MDLERHGITRRTAMKGIGGAAAAAVSVGGGALLLAGAGAAATVNIESSDTAVVKNDRGDVSKVTIDPSFRIEWSGFDTAVGKVMVLIEARTKDDGEYKGAGWTPVFRMTPWLTENIEQNGGPHVDYSKPGTTGYFEVDTLGEAVAYAARVREDSSTPKARPIEVVNEIGRPEYESETFQDYTSVDTQSYLEGDSIGSADQTFDKIGGQIVNNFPGADAGYYGAAIDTRHLDVDKDGSSDSDTVELRYTFAFYTPTFASPSEVGTGWFENVRTSDLQKDNGHSALVMNGEDGYPDITNQQTFVDSEASNHYESLRRMAPEHPSVTVVKSSFTVETVNETSDSGATGDSNTGAEGAGQ